MGRKTRIDVREYFKEIQVIINTNIIYHEYYLFKVIVIFRCLALLKCYDFTPALPFSLKLVNIMTCHLKNFKTFLKGVKFDTSASYSNPVR